MWHDPKREPKYSEYIELDLSEVVPSIAGPKRPQDRIALNEAKNAFRKDIHNYVEENLPARAQQARRGRRGDLPGQRPRIELAFADDDAIVPSAAVGANGRPTKPVDGQVRRARRIHPRPRRGGDRGDHLLHQHLQPEVMLGAALLAQNAVEKGLTSKPWVKTKMAPGSQVVSDYYEKAGLWPYLEKLGFYLVGYGCTTCIGNSGPLPEEISKAVNDADLSVTAVLSGNRNFEGRINPDVKMNYLASPPLVIAYALAGTMDFDFEAEPLGRDNTATRCS